jgi:two-component system phosphate regulon response regulator PhoB
MAATILVVEDEPAIQELVAYACRNSGFEVRRSDSVRSARDAVAGQLPDLVLLDWMLPDQPGIDWLRELRGADRMRGLPVIMLTAKGNESERVAGLDAGADDYVVKPFSPRELVSRIRAVFRRRAPQLAGETLEYGPLRLDTARHEVVINGSAVKMGLAEFKLLAFFLAHPERVFTRTQLLDGVWGDHVFIEERTVDVHMLRLRKALAPLGVHGMIQTVRGLGYRLSQRTD